MELLPTKTPTSPPKETPKRDGKMKKMLKRHFFILSWINTYNKQMAIGDLIAGITLGLTIIPQSIAYASLANLPSQYGLYAAFIGSIVYVFFGTVKEVSIGPTSLMALLIVQFTYDKPVEYVIVLAFLCGCVELLMGIFKLGFIVDFISKPVTSAFTSATALIIVVSQLKSLLGIKYSAKNFYGFIVKLFEHLEEIQIGDTILGIICIVFLLSLRKIKDYPTSSYFTKRFLWYLSISRNALIVIFTSAIAFYWSYDDPRETPPFKLSGKVASGIPQFHIPAFSVEIHNQTVSFLEICEDLGTGIILIPLVAVLANVAIAKSFSTGKLVDASQEMIALGLANIIGSCFQSMPTCGAFTRSSVSSASGIETPMAGIYSAIITLLSLSLLTPYFYYIPKSTLAAVLVCAVVFMIDLNIVFVLWQKNRKEVISWAVCVFVALLFGVERGLLAGIILSICQILHIWVRPATDVKIEEIDNQDFIIIKPNAGLFYPGIDNLREKASKASIETDYELPLIIDCSKISDLDFTSLKGLESLAADIKIQNQTLILMDLDANLQFKLSHTNIKFCDDKEDLYEVLEEVAQIGLSFLHHRPATTFPIAKEINNNK